MREKALVPYTELSKSRVALGDMLPLRMPLSMYVEPGNRCNFKCTFCPESFADYEAQAGGLRSLSFEDFSKVCADIKALGRLKVLRLYMLGEPLLHKDLPRFIRHAKASDVAERIEVTTNGTALTTKTSRELIEAGLDYLRVSIYASSDRRHLEVTGSKIAVRRIADQVRAFRDLRDSLGSAKPFVFAKMIDSLDDRENEAFFELYRPIADEVGLEPRTNWTGFEGRDLVKLGAEPDLSDSRRVVASGAKRICPYPFYILVVHADLDVSVCCADWNKKALVGNLRRQTLGEVWNSEELRAFQKMHVENRRSDNESCRNCTVLYTHPDDLDGLSLDRFAEILGVRTEEIHVRGAPAGRGR
jgi:radical SAM protein with 4Fe4S-binding SPASM domain